MNNKPSKEGKKLNLIIMSKPALKLSIYCIRNPNMYTGTYNQDFGKGWGFK